MSSGGGRQTGPNVVRNCQRHRRGHNIPFLLVGLVYLPIFLDLFKVMFYFLPW